MKANAFTLSVAECALLVPDGVRHAKTTEIVHQPSPADQFPGPVTQAEDASSFASEVGHSARVTNGVRRLDVGEVGNRLERSFKLRVGYPPLQGWLGSDDGVPAAHLVKAGEHRCCLGGENVHELRIELRPAPFPGDRDRGVRSLGAL